MPGFSIGGIGQGPSNKSEFHREHRWRVATLGMPTVSEIEGLTDRLISHVKSIQLPSLSFEEEKVMGSSFYYKFAKAAIWEDVTVKFYDVFGQYENLRAWQRLIWEPLAGLRPANIYKGQPEFELIGSTGIVAQTFKLINAYPKKISHGELSMESSAVKILSVTFSFDWAEITIDDTAALNSIQEFNAANRRTVGSANNQAATDAATAAAAAAESRPSRSNLVPGGIGAGSNLSGFSTRNQ